MDVGLTSEQLSLRDTVRDILRTECPPDAARQAIDDPERWRTLWKTVVDLGWTELAAPDCRRRFRPRRAGGGPRGMRRRHRADPAAEQRRAGRGRVAGRDGQRGRCDAVLADIAGGVVATLAVHSPGRRLPGAPMTLQHGRLRGRAVAVPNLSRAELIVTPGRLRRRVGWSAGRAQR